MKISGLQLETLFDEINQSHFQGVLRRPELKWNPRLRSSAGRFFPRKGSRWSLWPPVPVIELASYLLEEADWELRVWDTLAHEMIHHWLWQLGRPYGHTREFLRKMREMGVSRYNPVPRIRPAKYQYQCPVCGESYPSRKRLVLRACGICCRRHSKGRYDVRFKLVLKGDGGRLWKP